MDHSAQAMDAKADAAPVCADGSENVARKAIRVSRERERRYFDSLVLREGDFNPFTAAGWASLLSAFGRIIDDAQGQHRFGDVLDVGCGTGQSLQLYADRASNYVGLDLSAAMIAVAHARFPDRSWIIADATQLPFADQSFDLVAFSSVLHHMPDYLDALREALRVLRPGGWVFAYDPSLRHPAMALFRWPRSPLYSPQGVSPNESPLLPRRVRQQFRAAGFEGIRQMCVAGLSFRSIEPVLLRPFLRLYNLFDRALAAAGMGRSFGAFVLTAGRKWARD
jgi:SAM-dependent methyltransferase